MNIYRLYWLCYALLAIPVRSQLSALIFQKSMRKKDVKGAQKSEEKTASSGKAQPEENLEPNLEAGADGEDTVPKKEGEEEEADTSKSKQGTINLIGIDSKRISDFAMYSNLFPSTFFMIAIALWFLVTIIGWQASAAGLLVPIALLPINIHASKRYATCVDIVMERRDKKMITITEALQGIRQIKFNALEPQWQKKIMKVREGELHMQWLVFVWNTWLLFCWISGPIFMAAAALALHSWLSGGLSPSVAFTALAIFSKLEVSLSVVPELITMMMDGYVSMTRIQKHLDDPEKEDNTTAGDNVAFIDAAVAWPAAEDEDNEKFVVRDINISFPNNELR
jgi:ABC-type multidrug transport system fused ATPase/permease subunit